MILVTGGLGFIGTHTTRALLDRGHDTLPASRTPRPSPLLPGVTAAALDCTDPESLSALGRTTRIDTIVHLAAAPLGGASPLAEMATNLQAIAAVLHAAATWHVQRVIVASTIGVYAGVDAVPWREDAPLPVASPHPIPAAKKAGEVLALASGLPVVIARIGATWGPLGRPTSLFIAAPAMVHAAARGLPVEAPAGGADLLYAPDCGAALAHLATAPALDHTVYNIASGRPTPNAALAAALGAAADAPTDPIPHMDAARLRASGWAPAWTVESAAADYMSWLAAGHTR
ncbi:NAD(P)-dependent oxidoreductase [Dactylosporangium salmoneum]|uniref:NAD(P)-dependent oxidoreductase n=1 Tax=Dactylosporangium salmoneum TaxID=53361 RepID=A0ABN3HNF2_9ACTN